MSQPVYRRTAGRRWEQLSPHSRPQQLSSLIIKDSVLSWTLSYPREWSFIIRHFLWALDSGVKLWPIRFEKMIQDMNVCSAGYRQGFEAQVVLFPCVSHHLANKVQNLKTESVLDLDLPYVQPVSVQKLIASLYSNVMYSATWNQPEIINCITHT